MTDGSISAVLICATTQPKSLAYTAFAIASRDDFASSGLSGTCISCPFVFSVRDVSPCCSSAMFVWSRSEVRLSPAVPPTTIESPLTFSPSWMLPRWRRPASVWKTALSICSFTPICVSTFFDSLNPATSSWNFLRSVAFPLPDLVYAYFDGSASTPNAERSDDERPATSW